MTSIQRALVTFGKIDKEIWMTKEDAAEFVMAYEDASMEVKNVDGDLDN